MRSFIGWVGGKSQLAEHIVGLFPEHKTYVEVFGGAGWVLFKKDKAVSDVEIYNDVNGELVNLFRVVKHRPSALAEALGLMLYSHETYRNFQRGLKNKVDCEVDRAVRFYYLIRNSFGSGITTGWGFSKTKPARALWKASFVEEIKNRLASVYIENRSFEKLIETYDTKDSLFYLDPPYWEVGDRLYLCRFKPEDHTRLREVVGRIQGKWIMSYNDHPNIRKLYKGYNIKATKPVRYSLNNLNGRLRHKSEILICNF